VNLEQIYVDSEEFSFEELLAKKRGIYGLKFEVEKPKSSTENVLRHNSSENDIMSKIRSPEEHVHTKVKRSPLQQKSIFKTPSPEHSPHASSENPRSNNDDIVYMPIRGTYFN
jgi:hypothetical protein